MRNIMLFLACLFCSSPGALLAHETSVIILKEGLLKGDACSVLVTPRGEEPLAVVAMRVGVESVQYSSVPCGSSVIITSDAIQRVGSYRISIEFEDGQLVYSDSLCRWSDWRTDDWFKAMSTVLVTVTSAFLAFSMQEWIREWWRLRRRYTEARLIALDFLGQVKKCIEHDARPINMPKSLSGEEFNEWVEAFIRRRQWTDLCNLRNKINLWNENIVSPEVVETAARAVRRSLELND